MTAGRAPEPLLCAPAAKVKSTGCATAADTSHSAGPSCSSAFCREQQVPGCIPEGGDALLGGGVSRRVRAGTGWKQEAGGRALTLVSLTCPLHGSRLNAWLAQSPQTARAGASPGPSLLPPRSRPPACHWPAPRGLGGACASARGPSGQGAREGVPRLTQGWGHLRRAEEDPSPRQQARLPRGTPRPRPLCKR
ncbi:hypothetical protein NDU88_006466 [Pleurodeles waltl]|uniref:Uncharacterized protein n=1 Tax=Pleurodeles waltl TaxID=8319 RepID=A0AAV7SPU6_PLEWA|nr:hypothetical protein NDU88_006466 [Pleurodeles waltl]